MFFLFLFWCQNESLTFMSIYGKQTPQARWTCTASSSMCQTRAIFTNILCIWIANYNHSRTYDSVRIVFFIFFLLSIGLCIHVSPSVVWYGYRRLRLGVHFEMRTNIKKKKRWTVWDRRAFLGTFFFKCPNEASKLIFLQWTSEMCAGNKLRVVESENEFTGMRINTKWKYLFYYFYCFLNLFWKFKISQLMFLTSSRFIWDFQYNSCSLSYFIIISYSDLSNSLPPFISFHVAVCTLFVLFSNPFFFLLFVKLAVCFRFLVFCFVYSFHFHFFF